MNTLLHVFEAYGGLCRAAKSPAVEEKMRGMLDMFETKIYNPAKKRQEVFFNELWESLIDLTSYGHDIESSWLLEWGCSQLGDGKLLNHVKPICRALAEGTLEKAFRQGSLRYECVRGIEDERRIWWVQAEAVVGFLNAGMEGAAETVLTFIEKKIADPRPGSEWLSEVYPDGSHTENRAPIVEMWKCPYHNGRMCLEILRRMPE
jgi:mannobiose 2-epimerase